MTTNRTAKPAVTPIYGEHSFAKHIDLSAIPALHEYNINRMRECAWGIQACSVIITETMTARHDDNAGWLPSETNLNGLALAAECCAIAIDGILESIERQLLDAERKRDVTSAEGASHV